MSGVGNAFASSANSSATSAHNSQLRELRSALQGAVNSPENSAARQSVTQTVHDILEAGPNPTAQSAFTAAQQLYQGLQAEGVAAGQVLNGPALEFLNQALNSSALYHQGVEANDLALHQQGAEANNHQPGVGASPISE